MSERTQPGDPGSANGEPEKARPFDLIDEVPGMSADGSDYAGPDGTRADGTRRDGTSPDGTSPDGSGGATAPAEESATRRPRRAASAFMAAVAASWRVARRGAAAVRQRLPTTRRGKVLLAGGTAVLVLLVVVAGVLIDAQARERALVAAPGGVRNLASEPVEQWSIDLADPISATLVRMPQMLAIVGDGKVRGVDPTSGEIRWTVGMGKDQRCGPATAVGTGGPGAVAPADPLVCVSSSGKGEQDVTVIDPDGTVTTRALDADVAVAPAAGGGLVSFELTGGDEERRRMVLGDLSVPSLPKGFVGPDLVVRHEEAATGTERWSETVPFGSPRPESCVTYDQDMPALDVEGALTWDVRDTLVEVRGCGVSAAFLLDGTRLDDPEDPEDPPATGVRTASFAALPDGGWVEPGIGPDRARVPNDVVHLSDGGALTLDGQALVPWTTDGHDPELLLEGVGAQTNALSTSGDRAGEVLWTAPGLTATTLLARVSGTAVVVDDQGAVRAIDLGTGAERWTLDLGVLSFEAVPWAVTSLIFGAWTDGDTLLLAVTADQDEEPSGLRLLAVDLQDGSVRWDIEQDTPYTQLAAVDGYLAQITQHGVVGLGPADR